MIGAALATLILLAIAGILSGFELLHFGTPDKVIRVVSFPDQPGFWEKYQTLFAGVFATLGGGLAYFGAVRSARILHQSEAEKQAREHSRDDALLVRDFRIRRVRSINIGIAYCMYIDNICKHRADLANAQIPLTVEQLPIRALTNAIEAICFGVEQIDENPFYDISKIEFTDMEMFGITSMMYNITQLREQGIRDIEIIKSTISGDTLGRCNLLAQRLIAGAEGCLQDTRKMANKLATEFNRQLVAVENN